MGRTNLKHGLERKIAFARGELEDAQKEIDQIREGLKRLISLREQVRQNQAVVSAAETILKFDHPGWTGTHIKPKRQGTWSSPFRSGDQGQLALTTLREADDWLRPRDVAQKMLDHIGHDPEDEGTLDSVARSIGTYFKKYEGELVESRGSYAKEWRVIR
jgi:hypothetical protein